MRVVLLGNRHSPLTAAAGAALEGLESATVVARIEAPEDPRSARGLEALRAVAPDLLVSAGYTRILDEDTLAVARIGAVNVHPSLLPRYRGSYPVYWALYEGATEIGASVHEMVAEVDAGPIVVQESIAVAADDDPAEAYRRVCAVAGRALARALELIERDGRIPGTPQSGEASYRDSPWKELERLELDFTLPAGELARRTAIFPGCVNVAAGDGRVLVHRVRPLDGPARAEPGTVLRRRALGVDVAAGGDSVAAVRWLRRQGGWPPARLLATPLLARRLPARL